MCIFWNFANAKQFFEIFVNIFNYIHLRLYSKSLQTLEEWRFNLSFAWLSVLFLNSWSVSSHIIRNDTNPPAIQKQHCLHSREAQIEPPLFESDRRSFPPCRFLIVVIKTLLCSGGKIWKWCPLWLPSWHSKSFKGSTLLSIWLVKLQTLQVI